MIVATELLYVAGKYYLVDAAYTNQPYFLAPYKGERYHNNDFSGVRTFSGPRELFNRRHSSLRNVVERTFGVLKKRFPVLKGPMPPYKILRQCTIVIACCVVHNIIREYDVHDDIFQIFEDENADATTILNESDSPTPIGGTQLNFTPADIRGWAAFRDSIASGLWNSYTQ